MRPSFRESFCGGPNWNLRELYLNNNPLKSVKNIFEEMPHLEKLVLDEVVGLDLQETFSGFSLTHLKYLSLQNCNITSLPDDIFQDMMLVSCFFSLFFFFYFFSLFFIFFFILHKICRGSQNITIG